MHLRNLILVLAAAACMWLAAGRAHAAATVTVFPLARNGMPAPDANGSFGSYFSYHDPVLNEAGEVAFLAFFSFLDVLYNHIHGIIKIKIILTI